VAVQNDQRKRKDGGRPRKKGGKERGVEQEKKGVPGATDRRLHKKKSTSHPPEITDIKEPGVPPEITNYGPERNNLKRHRGKLGRVEDTGKRRRRGR